MSNIQHLIENGLGNYGKMSAEEWEEKMLQDPNWQPWIAITIDELYEICSYVENTHVAILNEIIDELCYKDNNMIVIEGASGTGKSAVAIQLFKQFE